MYPDYSVKKIISYDEYLKYQELIPDIRTLTEDDFVMGGAFGSITFGFSVKYEISPDFMVLGSFSQFDLINSQARDSVKNADEYYAKCDWPIIKIGFLYSF